MGTQQLMTSHHCYNLSDGAVVRLLTLATSVFPNTSGSAFREATRHPFLIKDIPFEWNERCEEAFLKLKESLTSAPVLHQDIGGHFHILTDASDTACGAAVCHRINPFQPTPSFWKCSQGLKDKTLTIDKKDKVPWIILVQKLFQNVDRK